VSAALWGLTIGFAAGSVPFAWLLHLGSTGRDLRREGSGNPGTTNLGRADGMAWGALALALDAGKAALAVLIAARAAGTEASVPAAAGAVLGHVFSPWLSFRGGRGVAPAAGGLFVVAPAAAAIALIVFLAALATTRFVSLSSVLGALSLAIALAALGPDRRAAAVAAGIALLIAWRHRENFARMRAGTEPRVGEHTPPQRGARR
jgi:glycerol-3-phosphate acyltransferase PlsY